VGSLLEASLGTDASMNAIAIHNKRTRDDYSHFWAIETQARKWRGLVVRMNEGGGLDVGRVKVDNVYSLRSDLGIDILLQSSMSDVQRRAPSVRDAQG